jgi:uronate dehydrogenase
LKRLLITGAAGRVGRMMRERLGGYAETLRLSDIAPLTQEKPNEEVVSCDLADLEAVLALAQDCEGIVHLGAVPTEAEFDRLLHSNIVGVYNIYEAARLNGCRRVFFASSSHTTGFYPRTAKLDAAVPPRPDTLYGVSKIFGEALARYYYDKFGLESVCVRIGSCTAEPLNRRQLAIWLSPRDLANLVKAVFDAPSTGYAVIYGMSDNGEAWWSNKPDSVVGWVPIDSSEHYRAEVEARTRPETGLAAQVQGGAHAAKPPRRRG